MKKVMLACGSMIFYSFQAMNKPKIHKNSNEILTFEFKNATKFFNYFSSNDIFWAIRGADNEFEDLAYNKHPLVRCTIPKKKKRFYLYMDKHNRSLHSFNY